MAARHVDDEKFPIPVSV
ncbi:unnamed protein product, partial [Rotaria sp. Silwood1]